MLIDILNSISPLKGRLNLADERKVHLGRTH